VTWPTPPLHAHGSSLLLEQSCQCVPPVESNSSIHVAQSAAERSEDEPMHKGAGVGGVGGGAGVGTVTGVGIIGGPVHVGGPDKH
jgi:hypothetical protein